MKALARRVCQQLLVWRFIVLPGTLLQILATFGLARLGVPPGPWNAECKLSFRILDVNVYLVLRVLLQTGLRSQVALALVVRIEVLVLHAIDATVLAR